MALQKTVTLTNNFGDDQQFENAYISIKRIIGNKYSINIVVTTYKTATKEMELHEQIYVFVPSLAGDNFIKQAYLYLKTLPEFADAIDC